MMPKGQNQKKQLFFLLLVILINVILWSAWYGIKKQTYQTQRVLESQAKQQILWKTHTDKKYGFSFQYPLGWITSADECPSEPFCLIVIDYNRLPTEKQLNKDCPECLSVETSDIRIFTKEQFTQFKTDLESGAAPQTVLKGWDFVKIADENGIQNVFYDIFSGTYILETIISHNNTILQIALTLPIENVLDKNQANIEKSEQKVHDLKQKKFDTATQKLIDQYNQLLVALTFTKSDFVFYQDQKTNLSFYYPSRYGIIAKKEFSQSGNTDFHLTDLHFSGNPYSDLDENYNSLTIYPPQKDFDKEKYTFFNGIFSQDKIIEWFELANPELAQHQLPNESQKELIRRLRRQSKKTYIESEVVPVTIRGIYYFIRSGNGVNAEANLRFDLLTEEGNVININLNLWSNEQSILEQQLNTIFKTKFGHTGLSWDEEEFNKWENNMNDFVQQKAFSVFKKELEEMKILVESLQSS